MASPAKRMTLEINPGSDPISGRLSDEHGTRPFFGWLELAGALEAALHAESAEGEAHDTESAP